MKSFIETYVKLVAALLFIFGIIGIVTSAGRSDIAYQNMHLYSNE